MIAQLCQRMAELKAAPKYEESKRESQQEIAMLPQTTAFLETWQKEVEELQQQLDEEKQRVLRLARVKQLWAEWQSKEREMAEFRQSKEKEVAELKRQLHSLQIVSEYYRFIWPEG